MSQVSEIIVRKHRCGLCNKEGHNKATCPNPPASDAIVAAKNAQKAVKVAERKVEKAKKAVENKIRIAEEAKAAAEAKLAEDKRLAAERQAEQDRKVAEKLAAEKKAVEEKAAAEKAAAEKKAEAWTPASPRPWAIRKDPVLVLIFEKIYDRNASMEYMNLREHWNAHPEDFKMLGNEHTSHRDTEKHYTFEVRKKFTYTNSQDGSTGSKLWVTYYHIHYCVNPDGKFIWTDLTAKDRHNITYTIAKFYNPA
jgi:hypothetical protein